MSGGTPVNFHIGFHTYAAEWETNQIRFYVDGILHFTVNKNSADVRCQSSQRRRTSS